MTDPISLVSFCGEPQFDRLPVLKLSCDPDTPPLDRVFAQAQLCRNESHIIARIWTFETNPAPDVLLSAQFCKNGHLLAATASIGGEASLVIDGAAKDGALTSYLFSREDLQGVYAGVVLMIPVETFFAAWQENAPKTGTEHTEVSCNLLRVGSAVSSLAPVGSWKTVTL